MSRTEIAAIAVRLLALAMFALAIVTGLRAAVAYFLDRAHSVITDQFVETNWEALSALGNAGVGFGAIVGGGVWLLLAVYYWQRAEKIAERMVSDDSEPVTPTHFTGDDVFAVGCRLVGIVVLVRALRLLVWMGSEFVFFHRDSYETFFNWSRVKSALELAVEFGLAIWLLFGMRGIMGLIWWARRAGTPEDRPDRSGDMPPPAAHETAEARTIRDTPTGERPSEEPLS